MPYLPQEQRTLSTRLFDMKYEVTNHKYYTLLPKHSTYNFGSKSFLEARVTMYGAHHIISRTGTLFSAVKPEMTI